MTKGLIHQKDTAILKMHAHSKKRFKLHEAKFEEQKREKEPIPQAELKALILLSQ